MNIIDRIKKLLNLAKDKCNKHVAEAAAQKAQQLITEHNINERMFEDNPREDPWWVGYLYKSTSVQVWELNLASELSRANYGAATVNNEGIQFVGSQRDFDVVKWLYQWVCKQAHELAEQEGMTTFKERNSYKQGIVATIAKRMQWAKQDAERQAKVDAMLAELDGKFALVPVDEATKQLNEYLQKVLDLVNRRCTEWGARSEVSSHDAYAAGMRDGHKVNLNAGSLN
jgi:hypothetical protein